MSTVINTDNKIITCQLDSIVSKEQKHCIGDNVNKYTVH